ncbi:hypothetical protein FG386_002747 [Cryptosporidium ryanae]|uniref:uncharacterized protein n=1 Tax=Cryptosporidium ryanae TaxID=515981 RepID=UPI003519FCA9|nr:hypothetical protein FG386_002747 [Cryptosporidium ryanae]
MHYGDEGFIYGDNTCRFSKTPQNILIVKRPGSLHVNILAVDITNNLTKRYNAVVYFEDDSIDDLKKIDENIIVRTISEIKEDLGEVIDLAISLGGDGTLLWLSHLFQMSVPPVIGISMGSLGYMSLFHHSKANEIIERVMEQKTFAVSLRSRLTLYFKDDKGEIVHKSCLNECVFERGDRHCLASIDVYCSGCYFTRVFADGLILATPSGSTAYSMSAGGSIVHPKVSGILFTPICPHTLSFRPLILPDSTELLIHIPESSRGGVQVALDGKRIVELENGQFAMVKTCSYPLPLVICPQNIDSNNIDSELNMLVRENIEHDINDHFENGADDYRNLQKSQEILFVCPICRKCNNCKCGIEDEGSTGNLESEDSKLVDSFENRLNIREFYRKDCWFDSLNYSLDWNSQRAAQIPLDMQEIVSGKYSELQSSLRRNDNTNHIYNNASIKVNRRVVPLTTIDFLKKVRKMWNDENEYKHEFNSDNKHNITYLNFKTKHQDNNEIINCAGKQKMEIDKSLNNNMEFNDINYSSINGEFVGSMTETKEDLSSYFNNDSCDIDLEYNIQRPSEVLEGDDQNGSSKKNIDKIRNRQIKARNKTTFFKPVKIPEVIILDRKM